MTPHVDWVERSETQQIKPKSAFVFQKNIHPSQGAEAVISRLLVANRLPHGAAAEPTRMYSSRVCVK